MRQSRPGLTSPDSQANTTACTRDDHDREAQNPKETGLAQGLAAPWRPRR